MFDNPQNRGRLVGGLALILLGILQIVSNNVDAAWEIWIWIVFFGVAAVGLGWVYRDGRETWAGILAYIAGALAALLFVIEVLNPADLLIPTIVLLLIAAPFIFAWTRDRQQWGLLIPAYVMVMIIPILYLGDVPNEDSLVPAYVLAVIGLPFIGVFFVQRQWPFLIPGGIMLGLSAVFLLGAIESVGPLLNAALAVGLIGGGAYLLLRPQTDDETLKAKHEGEG